MTQTLQIAALIGVLLYFVCLAVLLHRKKLNLRYSLLWIFSGVFMLILAAFPAILNIFAGVLGIYEPTNALFAILSFCMIMIIVSLTCIVSKLNEQVKQLAQAVAIMEKRLRAGEEER